jgi:4-hydroxybenzoate polyprenyltransferase/phosphoserine phosphatase
MESGSHLAQAAPALCVDLDGTLTRTDLTLESLLWVLKTQPWIVFMLPWWLIQGKSHMKARLANLAQPDATVLPYHPDVIHLIREARHQGRHVALVTGSHVSLAMRIADHLPLFDEVMGSTHDRNLTGHRKAAMLEDRFGKGRFDYVANSKVDLAVWAKASGAVTVNAPRSVVRKVARMGITHQDIPPQKAGWRTWLKAIRLQQWLKNLLLFIPVVTAHEVLNPHAMTGAVLAFLCFGVLASATYLINDMLDLEADRHHHKKRHRPFASGSIGLHSGATAVALLSVAGLALAWNLAPGFQFAMAAYLVCTLLYSLRLKRFASLDVIVLAGLYTLRIIAGAFAADISLSFWLLAFSMFIFLSLAMIKRVAELVEVQKDERTSGKTQGKLRGREYSTEDIVMLQAMGASSGYLAVLVLALYIHSPEVVNLYRTPQLLWLIAPLMLLWVTRLWVVTARGYMDEDPIFFAVKDPETWATGALVAGILTAATTLRL